MHHKISTILHGSCSPEPAPSKPSSATPNSLCFSFLDSILVQNYWIFTSSWSSMPFHLLGLWLLFSAWEHHFSHLCALITFQNLVPQSLHILWSLPLPQRLKTLCSTLRREFCYHHREQLTIGIILFCGLASTFIMLQTSIQWPAQQSLYLSTLIIIYIAI